MSDAAERYTRSVMALVDELRSRSGEIRRIAARHGAKNVRVFGSVARREDTPESDIDFLIELDPGRSLFDQASLIVELRELLSRDVDVVTERALKPRVRERVLADAVAL